MTDEFDEEDEMPEIRGRVFHGSMDDFMQMLTGSGSNDRKETVQAHYGVDFKESKERMALIFAKLLTCDSYCEVLDEFFADMDAAQRARVFEFAVKFHTHKEFTEWMANR